MMFWPRKLFVLGALFIAISFFMVPKAVAETLFESETVSSYEFGPYTYSSVEQSITIRPLQSELLPTSYTIAINEAAVLDATADQNGVTLPVEFSSEKITVQLDPTTLQNGGTFRVRYKMEEIVKRRGLLHLVTIPLFGSDTQTNIARQKIDLVLPNNWGKLQTSSTVFASQALEGENTRYSINISSVEKINELRLSFGDFQLYDVQLNYELQNDQSKTQEMTITLPPTFTGYQTTYVNSLTPKPQNVYVDTDGNVLAEYRLKPKEIKPISFTGQIKIDLSEKPDPKPIDMAPYLLVDQYWESNAPEIIELANSFTNAADVYDYVTKTLRYDTTRINNINIERYGALGALQDPDKAVCLEFTDLTIALLRAMNIPAREVDGFAFIDETENALKPTVSDVLHAWVQYYDAEKGWVQIDPTWGATTNRDYFANFDNDHLIFAIKGITSQGPHPAGVYKATNSNSKDVNVTFAQSSAISNPSIDTWISDFVIAQNRPWWGKFWAWVLSLFGG